MGRCRPARDGKAKFPRLGRWQACWWGSAALPYKVIIIVIVVVVVVFVVVIVDIVV